jgi:deoxycytidylate deaminase
MEALMQCARSGVSPVNGTLFTTTFPCHNCARHIIDAGIKRVLFVEPYPKSKASQLHSDAISIEAERPTKVSFMPFVGVAARRYFDLFSMRISSGWPLERKDGLKATTFIRTEAKPRVPMAPASFRELEGIATKIIHDNMR